VSTSFIAAHGGYRRLLSYQKAEVIFDITYRFCSRFLERRDRTVDQMVQAARSGKQNIAEGSRAAGTSTEGEIKLTNVARASLEELRIDYEDFLRVRGLSLWSKDSREATYDFVRNGGVRERMTKARLQQRKRRDAT
jgi:four helix bundle protein